MGRLLKETGTVWARLAHRVYVFCDEGTCDEGVITLQVPMFSPWSKPTRYPNPSWQFCG